MVFSVIYQTQTCINLGSEYTSSHTITDGEEDIIKYSATPCEDLSFDPINGDFTIKGTTVGFIQFIITVQNQKGTGYKIPIHIQVIQPSNKYLQYIYQTGYSFSAALHLFPTFTPEIDINKNENVNENIYENQDESPLLYTLVGAPTGINIDEFTGQISGNPINFGQFIATVNVINLKTNTFICSSSLHFMIYNSNILTEIIELTPNNEIIHSQNFPLTITCNYTGAPPSSAQSLSYKLTCDAFLSSTIINYISSDTVKLTYLVSIANIPGGYPIVLTDEINGFFISSSNSTLFTCTAACFNEDTTVLILNDKTEEKEEKEEFKCINEIKVGDKVKTYKHGYKKVKYIGSQTMMNNPDSESDSMYNINKRLSKEKIIHDLKLLGRHSLLVDCLSKRQRNKTLDIHPVDKIDDKELLITMFNDDFDHIEERKEFTYFHIVLEPENDLKDRRYGIYVNGSTDIESLRPGLIAATMYEKDFLKQFINK